MYAINTFLVVKILFDKRIKDFERFEKCISEKE